MHAAFAEDLNPPPEAVWIGSEHPFDLHEVYLCLRAGCALERRPLRARLFISADSRYRLWVNGQFVARGPARCYPYAQVVDVLDITNLLWAGSNLIAAQVYQPGYSHFAYVHRAAAGLLAWLECDGVTVLASGSAWRVRRDPSFDSLVPQVSIYGSGVEVRDLAQDLPWQQPGFDATGWAVARVVAPLAGYPWTGLQRRSLPLLAEREPPLTLLAVRRGALAAAADVHTALRSGWQAAQPALLAPDAEGWFRPQLAAGESAYWLFDLGQGCVCQGWAEVAGAAGNEVLVVSYAEKLRDGQLVISDPTTYCRVRLTDRFALRPGDQLAEGFSLRGGRYLLFQLTGPAGAGLRLRFRARVAEYPLEVNRELRLADPLLARIVAICETTFRACLADGFVDSTWRESSQWLGDALPQALIMAAMSADTRPLRRVIELAVQGAYPDGVLPGVVPAEVHAYTVVDYNFVWVELLALYLRLSGDEAFVTAMWPALVRLLERFHQDLEADGLLRSQPGRRLFLDWAPLSRRDPSAVYNLHYLLALRVAAELAVQHGAHDEALRWRNWAGVLRGAVRAAFLHADVWYDDQERTTCSQLAAALAVLSEAATHHEAPALLEAIIARSLDPDDDHVAGKLVLASPFMHHYLFEALRQGGKEADVVAIIRLRWGRWAAEGFPTTWENWSVDFPDGSQCHAFSAHPRYHLAMIDNQ